MRLLFRASPCQRGRALFAELRPRAILVRATGTLHLTLTSQVGGGRDGGRTLALGYNQRQQRRKPRRTQVSRLSDPAYGVVLNVGRSGLGNRTRVLVSRPAVRPVACVYLVKSKSLRPLTHRPRWPSFRNSDLGHRSPGGTARGSDVRDLLPSSPITLCRELR